MSRARDPEIHASPAIWVPSARAASSSGAMPRLATRTTLCTVCNARLSEARLKAGVTRCKKHLKRKSRVPRHGGDRKGESWQSQVSAGIQRAPKWWNNLSNCAGGCGKCKAVVRTVKALQPSSVCAAAAVLKCTGAAEFLLVNFPGLPTSLKGSPRRDGKSTKRQPTTASFRRAVWQRTCGNKFQHKCPIPWCRHTMTPWDFDVAHNKAVSMGSASEVTNAIALCKICNVSMGNKSFGWFVKHGGR